MKAFAAADLVFLDECGFSLALAVRYGWGKKGVPLVEAVPARRGTNLSLLGAFDQEGMVATTCKTGAMTRSDIEHFLQRDLLPRLTAGSVLILDNASIHKGGRIEALANAAGCRVVYLPPYSPDLNPIELAWAYVKGRVRKQGPREDAARQRAIDQALAAIPDAFAPACFRHCSYLQSH
jgi:transposase